LKWARAHIRFKERAETDERARFHVDLRKAGREFPNGATVRLYRIEQPSNVLKVVVQLRSLRELLAHDVHPVAERVYERREAAALKVTHRFLTVAYRICVRKCSREERPKVKLCLASRHGIEYLIEV
jgi:predicted RNase H-like nuclease